MVKDLETKFKYPINGSLRIGEKNEKNIPKKLDYFTVHNDTHTDKDVVEQFKNRFDKPKELTINFLSNEPFETSYLRYGKSGLLCKGDGEKGNFKDEKDWKECECSKDCSYRGNECKLTGKLFFVIKEFDIGGVWRFQTQSFNSIRNILTTLNFLKCMGVNITEHDFKLITEEKKSIVDGKVNKFTTVNLKMIVNSKEDVLKKSIDSSNIKKQNSETSDKVNNNNDYNVDENSKNDNDFVEETEKETEQKDRFEDYLTLIEIQKTKKSGKDVSIAKFCTMKDDEIVELLLYPDIVEKFSEYVPSSCILPLDIYEKNGNKILKDYKEIEIIKAV